MINAVCQAETEFQLWNQLEIRQVNITSETYRNHELGRLGLQEIIVLLRHVNRWDHPSDYIRTDVPHPLRRKFQLNRHNKIRRLKILLLMYIVGAIIELYNPISEPQPGTDPDRKIVVEPQLCQAIHTEPRAIGGLGHEPGLTILGDKTIVMETHTEGVKPDREPQVEAAHIGIWPVLNLVIQFLGRGGRDSEQPRRNQGENSERNR